MTEAHVTLVYIHMTGIWYSFVPTHQYLVHWLHLSLSLPLFTSETPLLLWIDCLHWWQDWLWPLVPPPPFPATGASRADGWPVAFFVVFFFPPSTLDAFTTFTERSDFPFWECSTALDFGLPLAIILVPSWHFDPILACTVFPAKSKLVLYCACAPIEPRPLPFPHRCITSMRWKYQHARGWYKLTSSDTAEKGSSLGDKKGNGIPCNY